MAIKAATLIPPHEAGDYNYSGISPEPSVPVGYTRYLTNIATASADIGSIFRGKTIENEMPVHLPNTVTPTGSGGYIDGFLIAEPSTVAYYIYTPSNGDYATYSDVLIAPATPIEIKEDFSVISTITSNVITSVVSKITSKITYN